MINFLMYLSSHPLSRTFSPQIIQVLLYVCGWLEIMSPLPEHGEFAEVMQDIARAITREL